ncbi:hypothetical protein AA103196_3116 [Ameyamaea chiangmaiensis NBRC 103196]|uniref:Uncharacterized protein n=1 Tax=Ameyamaea chiangmaiensis TaxID=442969 RepID=A0A850P601_9PROT|nr:hypothetical protein [Ameyamaea chiangmaiensis]MBS4074602.1 hypothetical protein [Ameyamaea chiangmaiensis]NVN39358.1 hypothetical protein [Ameyamaea chiangmaiensis]GBQ72631.1 hypothetical protein AA103196_3116 [Ameyamaea chiangmaiensis NBRC 103196]
MRTLTFTLPDPFPLLNVQQRKHYRTRQREKIATARRIAAELSGEIPAEPFTRAHVLIIRYSTGTPDLDGLYGGAKDLLDCLTTPELQANGKIRNKFGIGLIVDDSPKHITLTVEPRVCKRAEARTVVTVTEMVGAEVMA